MQRYRFYIDETGNHDLKGSIRPENRYLSLTGIIVNQDDEEKAVRNAITQLKSYFISDENKGVHLHRSDILKFNPPFDSLLDTEIRKNFDADFIAFIEKLSFKAVTVTMDKLAFLRRYGKWVEDPYHYCLEILIERYVVYLKSVSGRGDILIEARNKKLDRRLKKAYKEMYINGTDYISSQQMRNALTTKELKLKAKTSNISGLQLCDLLAHPACIASRKRHANQKLPDNFGGRIAKILEDKKYLRSYGGELRGWGVKWLP